jgi:hypothetical protein
MFVGHLMEKKLVLLEKEQKKPQRLHLGIQTIKLVPFFFSQLF